MYIQHVAILGTITNIYHVTLKAKILITYNIISKNSVADFVVEKKNADTDSSKFYKCGDADFLKKSNSRPIPINRYIFVVETTQLFLPFFNSKGPLPIKGC